MAAKFVHQITDTMTDWASIVSEVAVWFWEWFGNALNSNFSSSAIGSFAGAVGGAYAAQRIADKVKMRETIERQIRNTNSAILAAGDALNHYISLKRQLGVPLMKHYRDAQALAAKHLSDIEAGIVPRGTKIRVPMELVTLEKLPDNFVDPIVSVIRDKLSVHGQLLMIAGALQRSNDQLATTIINRNALIEKIANGDIQAGFSAVEIYLGLRNGAGHVNDVYLSHMNTFEKSLDDCIWFTNTISKLLQLHGVKMRNQNRASLLKRLNIGRTDPKVAAPKLRNEYLDMLPPDESYAAWAASVDEIIDELK